MFVNLLLLFLFPFGQAISTNRVNFFFDKPVCEKNDKKPALMKMVECRYEMTVLIKSFHYLKRQILSYEFYENIEQIKISIGIIMAAFFYLKRNGWKI